MKCKKLVAFCLAMAMSVTMLAGCGSSDVKSSESKSSESKAQSTEKSTEKSSSVSQSSTEQASASTEETKGIVFPLAEPLNVTAMGVLAKSEFPFADNYAWQYMEEITNVKVDIMELSPGETAEKMNLLLSSGDYPEFLFKYYSVDWSKYGEDGVFIPLEDLIKEYAHNLSALLDERKAWKTLASPDGHIYALPMVQMPNSYCDTMFYWMNQEWLDKLKLDMPTSQEELYQVLKAFKEQDPNGNGKADETPWIISGGSNIPSLMDILAYFGDGLYYGGYWSVVDGQMEYLPTTEYFKENFLKYMNKLYKEGLINEDAFTVTLDQTSAKGQETRGNNWGMAWGSSPSFVGAEWADWSKWYTLKPFDTDNFALTQGVSNGAFSITDKCKNPEIMMAWVDTFYSQEGGRIMRMGVEGKTYTISPDGKSFAYTDGFENVYRSTFMGAALVPGIVPDIFYTGADPEVDPKTWHMNNEIYGEGYGSQAIGVPCPNLQYSSEETDIVNSIATDVNGYVANYVAETITGIKSIDDTWAEFQSTLKAMGVEDWIKIRRAAYNAATSGN